MATVKLEKRNPASKKSAKHLVAEKRKADVIPSFEASPPKQPIDYAKMRKDIKARFSKTLAYLAK